MEAARTVLKYLKYSKVWSRAEGEERKTSWWLLWKLLSLRPKKSARIKIYMFKNDDKAIPRRSSTRGQRQVSERGRERERTLSATASRAINIIHFFVNSFRIRAHKIIHGNGWTIVGVGIRCLSGIGFALALSSTPIISIVHDDLLIFFNATHKNHRPSKVKFHVSFIPFADASWLLMFFGKLLMIFQKVK